MLYSGLVGKFCREGFILKKVQHVKKKVSIFFLAASISILMLSGTVWAEESEKTADPADTENTAVVDRSEEALRQPDTADTQETGTDASGNVDTGSAGMNGDAEVTGQNDSENGDSGGTGLPSYLEPTQKIDKLELTKHEPVTLSKVSVKSVSFTPQTGDDSQVMIWVGVMTVAVAAAAIIIIWKKRK